MQLKLVVLTLSIFWPWWSFEGAVGDPQLFFLTFECSTVSARDLSNLHQNRNASFAALRSQVSNQSKHFAAAQSTSGSDPVYATFQCKNYLSNTDCATYFAATTANICNCSTRNIAHLIYDDCFLGYTSIQYLCNNSAFLWLIFSFMLMLEKILELILSWNNVGDNFCIG